MKEAIEEFELALVMLLSGVDDQQDALLSAANKLIEQGAEPELVAPLLSAVGTDDEEALYTAAQRLISALSGEPEPDAAPDVDPATLADYISNQHDGLVELERAVLATEGGQEVNLRELRGMLHTMKGDSGMVGLSGLQALYHALEDLLDVHPLGAICELVLELRDWIEGCLEVVAAGEAPPDARELIDKVRAAAEGAPSEPRKALKKPNVSSATGAALRRERSAARGSIKLDLGRVDNLVELIGELVIIETMVSSAPEMLETKSTQLRNHLNQLGKIVRDLQRQGLGLRMVPLRAAFQRMERLVRDIGRETGKRVNLRLSGEQTEMDRSLVEQLGEPLIHMVRNAVDHGLEPPEERIAAGKPEVGELQLSAFHQGGNIVIELRDDGRGLDREKIIARAVERGILDPEAQLSDREAYELIFAPGFSTAERVTNLSGRGVGMDVVKRSIESMRGRVRIDSEPGAGTCFQLILPLTLAIIDGMLITCGSHTYVIPTLSIIESVQPQLQQIRYFADRRPVMNLRGAIYPLLHLGQILDIDGAISNPTEALVMVVDGGGRRFGLVVDNIAGQQQIVIKTLDRDLTDSQYFSGAAILSNGQVGLILNPGALLDESADVDPKQSAESRMELSA